MFGKRAAARPGRGTRAPTGPRDSPGAGGPGQTVAAAVLWVGSQPVPGWFPFFLP